MIDFESLLKKMEDSYALNLPFVAYREPNQRIVKLLIQSDDDLHLTNEYSKSGFIFAPFNTQEKSVLIPLDDSTYVEANFENIDFPSDELSAKIVNEVEKQKHIDLISEGIRFIKSNDVEKVVLSRKEDVLDPNLSPRITFRNLLNAYQKAMVYIWYHPKKGLWFGASPEKLIALRDNQFHTVSLAGTQPYRATDSVKWEEKEIEEQQIVTDYITSNLEPIADTVIVSKVKTVKAGNLLHLSTEISGNLKKGNSLYSIVNQLHPTPAVCGMPKDVAKTFIIENEGYNREFYTGFLGEVHMNNCSNLFVNLRCMKANNSKMTLFLGGGITIGSIPEKEWEETVEKSKVMKKVLRN
jgi:isochorismate synthase